MKTSHFTKSSSRVALLVFGTFFATTVLFFAQPKISLAATPDVTSPNGTANSDTTTSTANTTGSSGTSGSSTQDSCTEPAPTDYWCGACANGEHKVYTAIDIGCKRKGNPILDMLFAFIRFLSAGVGLLIVASIIYGGIQYTASRGDPSATAQAVERLRSNVIAMLIFLFSYAILNYVIPGHFLK